MTATEDETPAIDSLGGSTADSTDGPTGDPERRADVVLCPGGPMLVRGHVVVEDEAGVRHTSRRTVSAVCRCGKSARAPWCDGTHKLLPGGR